MLAFSIIEKSYRNQGKHLISLSKTAFINQF